MTPGYYAMFENNDPTRRMIALANHNNDIAEYWEWSAEGLYNPDPTKQRRTASASTTTSTP